MESGQLISKEYAVHFGLAAIVKTGRELGYKSINELEKMFNGMAVGDLISLSDAAHLMKAGLDRGCDKAGLSNDLSADDLLDMVSENQSVWQELTEELISSFQTGEAAKPETKKKPNHSPGIGSKKQP